MFAGDVRQGNEFGWQPWAATADWLGRLQDLARSGAGYLRLPTSAVEAVQATLRSTFHYVTDFRLKNSLTTRTSALDSLDGANTASALLNLRIHSNPKEQARYQRIVDSFNAVFPRIDVEVVEETPGSGVPDVRFRTGGAPVRMSQVSAGTQQILTLLVNLEARPNQVFFVEHPETHLHPHAIRAMRDVLRRASTESQVIIAIHDPRFVDPCVRSSCEDFGRLPPRALVWIRSKSTKSAGSSLVRLRQRSRISTFGTWCSPAQSCSWRTNHRLNSYTASLLHSTCLWTQEVCR